MNTETNITSTAITPKEFSQVDSATSTSLSGVDVNEEDRLKYQFGTSGKQAMTLINETCASTGNTEQIPLAEFSAEIEPPAVKVPAKDSAQWRQAVNRFWQYAMKLGVEFNDTLILTAINFYHSCSCKHFKRIMQDTSFKDKDKAIKIFCRESGLAINDSDENISVYVKLKIANFVLEYLRSHFNHDRVLTDSSINFFFHCDNAAIPFIDSTIDNLRADDIADTTDVKPVVTCTSTNDTSQADIDSDSSYSNTVINNDLISTADAADRVFAFKAELNKPKQQLDNLPAELVTQARWFKVLADKTPITNAWSKTCNQKLPADITLQSGQLLGFDIVGHGKAADYLVLDFDHVLDDDGNFVNATAEDWYNTICLSVETFCEKSISGHGLHFIFKPNDGEFSVLSASHESTLYFDNEKSKIEIFYKTGARYFLFTGDNYYCDPKTPIATDCSIVHDILKEISGRNSLNQQANPTTNSADDISHSREMLKFIDCAACTYDDWLKIGMALKTNGNPIDDWLDWSKTDSARYDEKTCRYKWNSFKRQELTIATIAYFAIQGGYKPTVTNNINDLYAQLRAVQKRIAEFDSEQNNAIEFLKNLETFDSKTVFSSEVINAAAFAKLADRKAYSDFIVAVKLYGDQHREEKAMINDLKAAIKDKFEDITSRKNALSLELSKIRGTIETQKFIADNPDFNNVVIPDGYYLSLENGVTKIIDDKGHHHTICECPVIIAGKTKRLDNSKFKLILQLWTRDNKPKILPPYPASTIFNARKIVDLADDGLSVSTLDAANLTGYLNAFNVENESLIPMTCTVPKCGWYDFGDGDIFIDPRRNCTIADDGANYPLVVDSQSQFAKSLTTKGDLSNWIQAYSIAKKSIVARCIIAAAVAPPLLKLLGERNFLLYIQGKTRAGKTTSLYLAASAIGTEKVIRSFDATRNGLLGVAADVNDYPFLVDERQVADNRLKDQFDNLIYALANGIGRTKLNKDSTVKDTAVWRTIAIMTGETPLLDDNVSGGAFTRLISIRAPQVILPADDCKRIRDIIKDHYGLVISLMLDKILSIARADLLKTYDRIIKHFSKNHSDILPEHRRYISVVTLADCLLNVVLGMNSNKAYADSLKSFDEIFKFIPTQNDIEDTERETAALFGFITQYQNYFIATNSKTVAVENVREVYGKDEGDCIFITVNAMKIFCKQSGFNYDKLIDDLIADNVIIPSSKIKAGHTTPLKFHQKKLGGINSNCYKLKKPADETTKENFGGFNADEFAGDYVPDPAIPFD